MMTTTMTTMRMKKSAHRMTTNSPPVHQRPTSQQEGSLVAVGTLRRGHLNLSPRPLAQALVRNNPQGGFGPADEPPVLATGERCFPVRPGRLRQERSPPAARAVPRAAASPQGQRCPRPAGMSQCPLREDHLPSDPFPLFVLFPPAATGHPEQGPLPRLSGYSTGPLDTCHGRAQVQMAVKSNR